MVDQAGQVAPHPPSTRGSSTPLRPGTALPSTRGRCSWIGRFRGLKRRFAPGARGFFIEGPLATFPYGAAPTQFFP